MRSKLAMLCLLLSVSCGKADDSAESSLKSENNGLPSFEDRTLDRVTFVTSHNSFVTSILKNGLLNQKQGNDTYQQLKDGVRGLMLDVYSYKGKAVMCHPICEIDGTNKVLDFFGVKPKIDMSVPFVDELKRIQRFMREDRNAVVTLHIEWTSGKFVANAKEFEAAFNQVPDLKKLIFDPYKEEVKKYGWPTVRDMITMNKRLLILSQSDSTKGMGVGHDRDFTVENYWSMGLVGEDRTCKSRWDDIPLDRDNTQASKFRRLFVMNHFRDVATEPGSLIDNLAKSLWNRIADQCLQSARRTPNYVAVDFYSDNVFSFVRTLNEAVGIAFADPNWGGKAQLITPGSRNLHGGGGELDNDTLSSMEIFYSGSRVALFDNDDQKVFMKDINSTTGNVGDINDRVSSWRVD